MNNLIEHAERELRILGYTGDNDSDDPDQWMYDNLMAMVKTFAEGGHSGFSASYALHILPKLLNFQNVTPLTNDPDEWHEVGDMGNDVISYQSKRRSDAFSEDGGKTYYLLDEMRRGWKRRFFGVKVMHTSEPASTKETAEG